MENSFSHPFTCDDRTSISDNRTKNYCSIAKPTSENGGPVPSSRNSRNYDNASFIGDVDDDQDSIRVKRTSVFALDVYVSAADCGGGNGDIYDNSQSSFDPYAYGNQKNATTFLGTVFHLYMISAGPALLSVPKHFIDVGYVFGSLVTFAVFALYWHTMQTLIWCEYQLCKIHRIANLTYSDTLYNAFLQGPPSARWFAPWSRQFVQVLYLFTWIGSLNVVLMAENLQVVYSNVFHCTVSVQNMMLFSFVPLLLLTWIHRLKYLVPLSIVGNGISALCVLYIVYQGFAGSPVASDLSPPTFGDPTKLPVYLGALLFTLNATGLMMPLKNEMRRPRQFSAPCGGVLTAAFLPMSFIFVFFNALCCFKYGYSIRDSVIENLPNDDFVSQIVIFLFAASLAVQQPLITYVVFDTLWNNMLNERRKRWSNVNFWEYTVRTVVFLVSFLAAYTIPNIDVFMSISGTIGTAFDSMIVPALAESFIVSKLYRRRRSVRRKYYIKNSLIVVLAMIVLYMGLSTCGQEIARTWRLKSINATNGVR